MNLFKWMSGSAAAAAIVAAVGLSAASPAQAASTPVTVPYLVGVNTTTNLYDAPNLGADYVGQAVAGQTWFAQGTDSTGAWTEIQITPSIFAWGATSAFALNGITLPVISGYTGGPLTSTTATAVPPAPAAVPTTPAAAVNTPAATSGMYVVPAGASVMVGVNSTTNVYDTPTQTGNVVGQLIGGQTWFVVGQDTTGKWIEVQITPNIFAWAPSSTLGVSGIQLPVVPGVTGS